MGYSSIRLGGERMTIDEIIRVVSTLGFPVCCVIGLGIFIWQYGKRLIEDNANLRTEIMNGNKERENRLHEQLVEAQAINKEAIATLAKYADRLDNIEDDIGDIKNALAMRK